MGSGSDGVCGRICARALLAAFAFSSLLLPGCAALDRGVEDVAVVLTFPVHAVTTPAARLRDRYGDDPRAAVVLSPLLVPIYFFEDACFTGASAADGALTPFYAPFQVEPLGLYDLSGPAPRLRTDEVVRSEEEFLRGASYALYVFAWFGVAWGPGHGGYLHPVPPSTVP